MAKKRPAYTNPPLVEVFCEFFFETPDDCVWDSFLVPEFYDKILARFPTRKPVRTVAIELKLPHGGQGFAVRPQGPPTPRTQFLSEDGKSIVQVGENLLVVNQLPPYYGWENFEPVVVEVFETYLSLWKPAEVGRQALHYIDKVDVPATQFELGEYFNLYPVLPKGKGESITNLAMAFELVGADSGDVLAVAFRQHPSADPDGTSFLFQFDYVATQPKLADVESARTWLTEAHDFTQRYFESVMTTKCKGLFR